MEWMAKFPISELLHHITSGRRGNNIYSYEKETESGMVTLFSILHIEAPFWHICLNLSPCF